MALEAWLTEVDDETLAANKAQLKDYISRGTFGGTEREFVHSALLRLYTKKFASSILTAELQLLTCILWNGSGVLCTCNSE